MPETFDRGLPSLMTNWTPSLSEVAQPTSEGTLNAAHDTFQILQGDATTSPKDIARAQIFQDYLDYCRGARNFVGIDEYLEPDFSSIPEPVMAPTPTYGVDVDLSEVPEEKRFSIKPVDDLDDYDEDADDYESPDFDTLSDDAEDDVEVISLGLDDWEDSSDDWEDSSDEGWEDLEDSSETDTSQEGTFDYTDDSEDEWEDSTDDSEDGWEDSTDDEWATSDSEDDEWVTSDSEDDEWATSDSEDDEWEESVDDWEDSTDSSVDAWEDSPDDSEDSDEWEDSTYDTEESDDWEDSPDDSEDSDEWEDSWEVDSISSPTPSVPQHSGQILSSTPAPKPALTKERRAAGSFERIFDRLTQKGTR